VGEWGLLSSRFLDPQFFLVYADRRFFEVGGKFLLKAISASSRNLLLRGGSPGPHSQPIFGGGDFKLCDGAIHRPFFGEERSPFLAFLKPCDDMAQDWIVAGRILVVWALSVLPGRGSVLPGMN